MMHEHRKSDSAIVAAKPTNKAGRPAAEPVERRAGTEGNAGQHSTRRAQHRESVSQALGHIRQIAKRALRRQTPEVGAVCGKSARPDVCPVKAGVFSRRQTCRGKSQAPRSLDGRVEGNQDSEAHRQGLPRGDHESPGRKESERESGLESE